MKTCSKCKIEKSYENFHKHKISKDGHHSKCKVCRSLHSKQYNELNKEKRKKYNELNQERIKEFNKKYYQYNKEILKKKSIENYYLNIEDKKDYREKSKERIKEWNKLNRENRRKKYKIKRNTDHLFKFRHNVRSLIGGSFKRGTNQFSKKAKTETILGCTIEEFRLYIESKFKDGMTLSNHGKWHLDHIIPLASATTEEEIIKLNHYTNFQPLWAEENIRKGNRLDY